MDDFAYADLLDAYSDDVKAQVQRFVKFCRLVGVALEPFQRLIISEVFDGRRTLLALLPTGNGKSTLFAAFALFHIAHVQRAQAVIAAASDKQAKQLWDLCTGFIEDTPALQPLFRIRIERITCVATNGTLERRASDSSGKSHGLPNLTLALIDELHAHANGNLYVGLRKTLGKRPEAQLICISTGGMKQKGILWEVRAAILEAPLIAQVGTLTYRRSDNGKVSLLEWALPQDADVTTLTAALLKSANPATFVTLAWLAEELDPSSGLQAFEVAAYHANIWARLGRAWLPAGAWTACREDAASIPLGADVYAGLDIGVQEDSTGLVLLHQREEDDRVVVEAHKIWTPEPGHPVYLPGVLQAILDVKRDYALKGVVLDKWNAEMMAQMLSDKGVLMIDHKMTKMVQPSKAIYEGITAVRVAWSANHPNAAVLGDHVNNGVSVPTEYAWKLAKNKDGDQTDLLIAMTIGYAGMRGAKKSASVYSRKELLILGD